jgi:hypothetical protein
MLGVGCFGVLAPLLLLGLNRRDVAAYDGG